MSYRIGADLVLLLHLAFILYATLGGLLVLRWRWSALLHLPALTWGVLIEFRGWICPLTLLENHLRRAAGEAGYPGGFIEHYLVPLIYPPGLERGDQMVLGGGLLLLNLLMYAVVLAFDSRVHFQPSTTEGPSLPFSRTGVLSIPIDAGGTPGRTEGR